MLQATAQVQQKLQRLQSQADKPWEVLAAVAQQRFAAAQAAIAALAGTDVLVATPDTLLSYVSVNQQYRKALSHLRGSSSDGNDSSSDEADSDSDDVSTSCGDSDNPGDLLRFDQLYWIVADEAGLREAVQQQIEKFAATGDDELGDPVSLRETWCQQLSRIAGHLRSAEVDHGKYPTAGEVEMSETARMVYLAEVSSSFCIFETSDGIAAVWRADVGKALGSATHFGFHSVNSKHHLPGGLYM